MTKQTKRYKQKVYRLLPIGRRSRIALMSDFETMLARYLEETPDPTWEQLIQAFGAPESMAATMMEKIPQDNQARYSVHRRGRRIALASVAGVLAAAIIGLCVFFYLNQEVTIVQQGYITEHNETLPVESEVN